MNHILLTIAAFAMLVAACVPITPEPDAPDSVTSDCTHGYLDLLPGQRANDPTSEELPGHIDIVAVASKLDGETLTAIFYLKGVPEELTINREGVDPTQLEYMWSIEIKVAGEDTTTRHPYSHLLSTFPFARNLRSVGLNSPPTESIQFGLGSAFQKGVWIYRDGQGENTIAMELTPTIVNLEVSREDNSLTLIGRIPGITPDTPISFSTFDILLGQDGVSCLPIET